MTKTYRLNRKGFSNYCLFIVDEELDTVEFRRIRFYTGPIEEERRMTLEQGRKLYKEMLTEKVVFLPHDQRNTPKWVPAS